METQDQTQTDYPGEKKTRAEFGFETIKGPCRPNSWIASSHARIFTRTFHNFIVHVISFYN